MTKSRALSFADANAFQDRRRNIVQTAEDINRGLAGYAACLSVLGISTKTVRTGTADAVVARYRDERGVMCVAPTGTAQKRARRPRQAAAIKIAVPWSGQLVKAARTRKAA